MDVKKKKLGFRLILLSLLFLPGIQVLFIIGCNSNYLIRFPFFIVISIISILLIVSLIHGINVFLKNRDANKRRLKKWIKVFLSIFMMYILCNFTIRSKF